MCFGGGLGGVFAITRRYTRLQGTGGVLGEQEVFPCHFRPMLWPFAGELRPLAPSPPQLLILDGLV